MNNCFEISGMKIIPKKKNYAFLYVKQFKDRFIPSDALAI